MICQVRGSLTPYARWRDRAACMKLKDIAEWSGRWSTPLRTMEANAPIADGVLIESLLAELVKCWAEDSEVCGSFWPWVLGGGYANVRQHIGPVSRPVGKVSWTRVQDFSILLCPGSPLLRFLYACSFGVESVDVVPFRLATAEQLGPKYPYHH